MRLFLALVPDDAAKDKLEDVTAKVKSVAVRGSFVPRDNLHLTLAFLGEQQDTSSAMYCLDHINASAFRLRSGRLGRFRREEGSVVWAGLRPSPSLQDLHNQLKASLSNTGFQIEQRKFKPHITLGKRVILQDDAFNIAAEFYPDFSFLVNSVVLMSSENTPNGVRYVELAGINLM